MPSLRFRWIHYGLFLILLAILAVVAILLQTQWSRSKSVVLTAQIQADSTLHLAFQLDKEFLRLKHQVELDLQSSGSSAELQNRFEILLSRLDLLTHNPSTSLLQTDPHYQQLIPRLQTMAQNIEPLVQQSESHPQVLFALREALEATSPDLLALIQTTNRVVVRRIEEQERLTHHQDFIILSLSGALLLFLLLGFMVLMNVYRKERTERSTLKSINRTLELARARAEDANHAKSRFLANMSHELRTPFNGLLGTLQLLDQSSLTSEQKSLLSTAVCSAGHLLNLLNDILDMSALDAGKLNLRLAPVNVLQTVEEVVQWMAPSAQEKKLSLTVQVHDKLPPTVEGDATRIRQVLLNLISNAIKFTDIGHIDIEIRAKHHTPSLVQWQVQVKDTGKGMSPSIQNTLFQRFQPGDSSITRTHNGTGLGLEISRSLAHRMGGDILVDSQEGSGSTFIFEWNTPLCLENTTASPPLDKSTNASDLSSPPILSPEIRVLVVEDNPVNRQILGKMLQQLHCHVEYAENGLQGFEKIQAQFYSLVLMDLHMPMMDGFTCTQAIRALTKHACAQVPIVAVTADVLPETQQKVKESGFSDYLSKPIIRSQLEACIIKWHAING